MLMTKRRGFTLIEVMIVVAVVAILVSIAVPSYSAFVLRANRTTAMEAVLKSAACLERIYSRTGAYVYDNTCKTTPKGYQKLKIVDSGTVGQEYRITAVPKDRQANDPCFKLRIDHRGRKLVIGASKPAAECWAGR